MTSSSYLCNAFSLNMLPNAAIGSIKIAPCENPAEWLLSRPTVNAIGHADTDSVIRNFLRQDGVNLSPGQRMSIALKAGDEVLVAQYKGPRLPEGATKLPEGASIEWLLVRWEPK